jgi:drug/metabolite transporter (DMT)-like permease
MDTDQARTRATLGGFAAILLWSTTVAIARSLAESLGPITAAAAVYTVSGTLAVVRLLRSASRRQQVRQLPLRYLCGCGLLFIAYMLLLFLAIGLADNRQQVLEIGLLNYLWPVLTVLLSVWLLGAPAGRLLVLGAGLALLGTFLVLTHNAQLTWQRVTEHVFTNPTPYVLGLTAALCWALYSVLTRRWAAGRADGAIDVFLPTTALALVGLAFVTHEPRLWQVRPLAEASFLGVATYFAYGLWDTAMRRGEALLVAVGSYITPLLSTIVTCLYLAVIPGERLWIGCGLLIIGSLLSWYSLKEHA